MKKILLFSAIILFITSCSKDSPSVPDPKGAPKISAVPSTFLQKVVIENFTMTSNGQCPRSQVILDSIIHYNPDRVYGMTIHVDDIMADTNLLTSNGFNYIDS